MSDHCDSETLALMAIGEPGPTDCVRHLEGCSDCSEELASLREAVVAARSVNEGQTLTAPPASVWAGITAELGSDAGPVAAASGPTSGTTQAFEVPASGDSGTADGGIENRTVADLASRRRPRTRWLALAAAVVAGAVVGGAVVAGVIGRSDNDAPVLAAAELGPVPGGPEKGQSGTAQVQQGTNGTVLALNTTDLAQPDGFYEAWLMDAKTGGLVAMGTVPYGQSSVKLPIPAGLDLSQFSTVDVSVEPLDGDPKHSAVSVLRGQLAT